MDSFSLRYLLMDIPEWDTLLEKCGCDSRGVYTNSLNINNESKYNGFKNSTFEIFPYYWGDCTCGGNEKNIECTNDCLLMKPNFIYFPDETIINWYKYPFRSAYSNKDLKKKEWKNIFKKCINSIKLT